MFPMTFWLDENFACFSPGIPLFPFSMDVTDDRTMVPSLISTGFFRIHI